MEIDAEHWPAFSLLMDQMLDLPPAQRAAWVAGLTGEAAALAPQLLTVLQAGDDPRTSAWFDTLPKLPDEALRTLMESGTGYEQAGDEVGPYRLVRLLGRGGMGSVWYAERSDRLMRRGVALKLPQGGSPQMAARFERERDIVASLVHPYIARLYDAGVAASGQAYLALEYVEGVPIDQYCDGHRMGSRARIALFAQVLSAVQYAHSRLVIHRDLKPSNILVTNEGEVRLLDFGVAKMLESGIPEASDLTRVSDAGMTLAYASPEQVAGRPVTTASDVYSLGVVLFELLVGTRPYKLKRDSRGALEDAILQADIPLASASIAQGAGGDSAAAARSSSLKMLRKDLRGDLDAILGKALSRRPQDRYETAASFADDLERFCSGRPVRAHRRSGWYATRKFIRRNQIAVSASCATVVTLAAATAIALSQAREAAHQARLAANERDRALAAAAHREAVDDFMSDLLLEAGRTGKPVSVSALIARADALSDREFANDPEARAAVLRTVGTFELEFDGPDRALDSFDKAQKILENTLDSGLRASVSCDRALLRGVMGNVDEAERTLAQTALDPQTPEDVRSECDGNQAQLAIFRGDGVGAIKAAERAIAEWEASARRSPTRHLELLTYRAEAQKLNGEPGKADADFVHVLDELGKLGRERGPFGYTVRNYRIGIAMETGNPRLALSLIDESISMVAHDISDRSLPLMTLYQRSREIDELGRHEEALRGYRHVAEASRSKNDVLGQRAMLDAAAALSKLGRHREAERLFDSAVPANGRLPPGQSRVGGLELAWRMTRAKLDLDVRAFSEARASVGKAMALPGLQPSSVATLLQIRAQANLGIGEFDKALQDAQAALDLNQKQRGDQPCSLRVGQSQIVLGQSLQAVGKLAEAQRAYSVALEQIIPCAGGEHPDGIRAKALLERISHKKLGASST